MRLLKGNCDNCGGHIEFGNAGAGACVQCGTPFIREQANINIHNTIVHETDKTQHLDEVIYVNGLKLSYEVLIEIDMQLKFCKKALLTDQDFLNTVHGVEIAIGYNARFPRHPKVVGLLMYWHKHGMEATLERNSKGKKFSVPMHKKLFG